MAWCTLFGHVHNITYNLYRNYSLVGASPYLLLMQGRDRDVKCCHKTSWTVTSIPKSYDIGFHGN